MSDTPSDSGSLRVNMKDVYALVLEVQRDLADIKRSLAVSEHVARTGHDLAVDHEDRLRLLEQWKYAIPTTFVLAALATAATIVSALVTHA